MGAGGREAAGNWMLAEFIPTADIWRTFLFPRAIPRSTRTTLHFQRGATVSAFRLWIKLDKEEYSGTRSKKQHGVTFAGRKHRKLGFLFAELSVPDTDRPTTRCT